VLLFWCPDFTPRLTFGSLKTNYHREKITRTGLF
jgi:hypothetical protein